MKIVSASLDRDAAYKLLTGVVVPRPIAWVTTISASGVTNLAPFSAFTMVSNEPPMIGISISRKAGVLKDTARNIHDRREFVVNIADETMIEKVHLSSTEYDAEVSEVEALGLALASCDHVDVPRLTAASASLECRFSQSVKFGRGDTEFIVGEIIMFHIRDELYDNGKIDSAKLRPICRVAGPSYARIGDITTLKPTKPSSTV